MSATRHYLGIAEPYQGHWNISFPAFPGVTSAGDTFAELLENGRNALATAVEAAEEDGSELPPDYTETGDGDLHLADYREPHMVVLSVEITSRAARINVTMDEGLVLRVDRLAERKGTTRSALLAKGARLVLSEEAAP